MTKRNLVLQLLFRNPELISQFQEDDLLEIKIKNENYFVTDNQLTPIKPETVLSRELPN